MWCVFNCLEYSKNPVYCFDTFEEAFGWYLSNKDITSDLGWLVGKESEIDDIIGGYNG